MRAASLPNPISAAPPSGGPIEAHDSSSSKSAEAPGPARSATIVAHKFGGSSLADAGRIRHVAMLVRDRDEDEQVVVVSAMQGVTDSLIALTHAAAAKAVWRPQWEKLRERHLQLAFA